MYSLWPERSWPTIIVSTNWSHSICSRSSLGFTSGPCATPFGRAPCCPSLNAVGVRPADSTRDSGRGTGLPAAVLPQVLFTHHAQASETVVCRPAGGLCRARDPHTPRLATDPVGIRRAARRGQQGVVYQWESGKRRPSPVFWARITALSGAAHNEQVDPVPNVCRGSA